MGNSMFSPDRLEALGWLTEPVDFYNENQHRHYRIFREGPKVYESEYGLDASGQEVFRHTEPLAYVIGTGVNGATPIVRRGDYLFQAPISYYAATKSWDLSPNYDVRDMAFNLPVTPDCVGCHSGRVQPVRGEDNLYGDPPVLESAIGCESCHGPGELHVLERQMGNAPVSGDDATIVNPAKLPPWLADNICMNCHEGDIRVFQQSKSWTDFRPGTPLNNTVLILKAPIDPRSAQSPLLEHYYSITLSQCYRGSRGRMDCQSCHDPHIEPSSAEAPGYFRGKCLQCHNDHSCTLDPRKRQATQPPDACATCHMPKRPALTVSHSSLTDHRILRVPGEAYPKSAFVASVPGTGFIHVDAVPGEPDSIPQIALLKAYRKELMRSNLQYRGYYFALLDRLTKSGNEDPFVLSAEAQKAGSDGNLQLAIRDASQVVKDGSDSDSDYLLLDDFLARADKLPEAIDVLKKGLSVAPYSNALYEKLAAQEFSVGDATEAKLTLQKALVLFPEDSALQNMQSQISANDHLREGIALFQRGNTQAAMDAFQAAVKADPANATAHDYLGVVFGESGQLNQAMDEFQQAVHLAPALPQPHFHLGLAYEKTGKTNEAITEYQEALRLNPKMVEAMYSLSAICSRAGDLDGAILLLRRVTDLEPDFAEAHYNLGLNLWNRYKNSSGLRQKADLDEAAEELKKAGSLAPREAAVWVALGQLLSDRGDLATAVTNLQKGVALQPSNAQYHYDLGLALRLKGNLDAAGNEFRTALKLDPQHALAHRSLGLVLREDGDFQNAALELRVSVTELPDDAEGHHLLGTVLLKLNDLPGAIEQLQKAVALDPTLTDARAGLAQALQKAGRKDEARQEADELRQITLEKSNLGQAMILMETAAVASRKKEFSSAVTQLQQAVSLSPHLTEAHYELAVALFHAGNTAQAEVELHKILQSHPDHALAHLQLGLLLEQKHESAPAGEELKKALQLAPSLVEAHLALGRIAQESQNWPEAVQELESVLAWRPKDAKAHYDLAMALKASGKSEEAAQELKVAQELDPTVPSH